MSRNEFGFSLIEFMAVILGVPANPRFTEVPDKALVTVIEPAQ
jgi:hypothetical protein